MLINTGCQNTIQEKKTIWYIDFQTGKTSGVCYHMYEDTINTQSGKLIFENQSPFPIHLMLYNNTLKRDLVYQAILNPNEVVSYNNIAPDIKYCVGLTINDTLGSKDGLLMVYDNYNSIKNNEKNKRLHKEYKNKKLVKIIKNIIYGCSM